MGYTTDFFGEFTFDRPLTKEHADYLNKFSETRRMKRDAKIAETLEDPVRIAAGLPIGDDGAYFVGGDGFAGQEDDASVIDHNTPPGQFSYREDKNAFEKNEQLTKKGKCQPGLWCQWIVGDEENKTLVWDGGEKFYEYTAWLKYLIDHFIAPWGYKLNGEVEWQGEEREDMGVIVVVDNVVKTKEGKITYE